jgi:hypothetical protein
MGRTAAPLLLAMTGCFHQAQLPTGEISEAAMGRCGATLAREALCGEWEDTVDRCDGDADEHASFPELDPRACYIEVRYKRGALPRADGIPQGCGYPRDVTAATARLEEEAARYDAIASGDDGSLPMALDCALPDDVRRSAAATNARTLERLRQRIANGEVFPYAAVSTFGFGHAAMNASELVPWRPGDRCPELSKRQMDLLSINRMRAGRASAAYHGRVGPVITVSGGAVHADLYEAFMLYYLATCRFGVPTDAVLLDPCADHTHTNIRNTGGLLTALGARTGYIVTSDGLQAAYLQEYTAFSAIGGSIDQRALRDWGYLLGAWRQASVGIDAGFWFTPYRFWGEPEAGLGSAACVY